MNGARRFSTRSITTPRARRGLLPAAALVLAACDRPPEAAPAPGEGEPIASQAAALQGNENFSPKPGAYLNSRSTVPLGLGVGIDDYYTKISAGLKVNGKDPKDGKTKDLFGADATQNFDLWKKTFNFIPRETGQTACTANNQCITGLGCDATKKRCKPESLQHWRDRTGVVVYYNINELGLGRELGCMAFPEHAGSTIKTGYACFVTNYGTFFQDQETAIKDAIYGVAKKNTVCITYRPGMNAPFQVQFWVFDGEGNRRTYAQLDHMGKRPVPQVCTRCHAGQSGGLEALEARFLPLNPFTVKWADQIIAEPQLTPGLSFGAQAERVRKINAISTRTPLSDLQKIIVNSMYGGKVDTTNQPARPPAMVDWTNPGHGAYFEKVITPYCGTCHFAFNSPWLLSWANFQSPGILSAIRPMVCNHVKEGDSPDSLPIMPNAEPAVEQFWGTPIPISFPNMKAWFLSEGKMGDCDQDEIPLGCNINRTPANPMGVPDNTKCGEQPGSGRTCDGLCNDECKVNADCPANSECLGQRCVDCGKYGQLACTSLTPACNPPFVKKGLMCDSTSDPVNKTTYCKAYVQLHDPKCSTWDHTCDNEAYIGQRCDLGQSCPTGWRDDVPRPGCWEHASF
jgi:hypothetical protein